MGKDPEIWLFSFFQVSSLSLKLKVERKPQKTEVLDFFTLIFFCKDNR
jgi:hypothetical protein